jgi:hypothetical protein
MKAEGGTKQRTKDEGGRMKADGGTEERMKDEG